MIDNPRLWSALVEAWRRSDWHDGLVTARLLVDDHPDDLGLRFMLAALYLRVGNPALALLQYEKLLTSAVGQRDLWRALAAQRQLDRLGGSRIAHPRRFAAMLQWFRSVAPRVENAPPGATLTPGRLLRLSPDDFAYVAESVALEELSLESADLASPMRCVVLYGSARCSDPGAAPPAEWLAAEGQPIVPPGRVLAGGVALVGSERPAAVLRFGAALDECLGLAALGGEAAPTPRPAGAAPAATTPPAPPAGHAPARAGRKPASPRAELPASATTPIPAPGSASAAATPKGADAPRPARRVQRLALSIEHSELAAAVEGFERPLICGRVLAVTPESVEVRLDANSTSPWRDALAGRPLPMDLELRTGEDPVHAEARLVDAPPAGGGDALRATIVLSELPVLDRARVADALIRGARPRRPAEDGPAPGDAPEARAA